MKKAISILAAASVCLSLTACSKMVYYTADDYMDVTVSGVNGKGSASVMFDKYNLLERINNDLYKGKADDMQLAKAEIGLYEYVEYDILDDNTENLSNGDTIAIKVTGNNEALSEFGFGVDEDNSVFIYTVEGLEEPTVIDLFKDVEIEMTGTSPYMSAEVEYKGNDSFIKENVRYSASDLYNIANGDTITVSAIVNDRTLEEYNYIAEVTEKDYEINGYEKYADANSDFSSVAKCIDEYAHSLFVKEGKTYSLNWENDARAFFKDGSAFEYWTIRKETITPVKTILYTSESKDDSNNSYNIFYRLDMEIEKTDEKYAKPNTIYDMGDIEKSSIYFCVDIYNIIEKPDGSIEFNENNRNTITYSTSLFGNYVGADLNEVSAARDKNMYNHKSEELDVIVS
ncbi:MAG: hypothetical protein ACI4I1_10390 [Oscillospiraceae bacterium]